MEIAIAKHKRVKGLILKILKKEYPKGVDSVVMRSVLSNLRYPLAERDMAAYLHYLSDAGYVKAERDSEDNILWVCLTNKGLNLIDGLIKDDAIILG